MCDCDTIEERAHFLSVINSLKKYKSFGLGEIEKTEAFMNTLPRRHQNMLKSYVDHLQRVKEAIIHNDSIIQLILEGVDKLFVNIDPSASKCCECAPPHVPERSMTSDITRIEASFKHIFRDWSSEGFEERKLCYAPIVEQLLTLYPDAPKNKGRWSVLVPGAGLGRLVHDISLLGFKCQGNEFSLFMMFFSQFVLNRCKCVNQYSIYPWVHQFTNNLLNSHHLRRINFPDVNPSELSKSEVSLSMAAGDFLEVYKEPDVWNCVVTCFFIDCAHNIVDFIERIFMILKPGGHWINMGPLLYHFSSLENENSIEPSYQEVRHVIQQVGFKFKKEQANKPTLYCQNPNSMTQFHYNSLFFTCVKPIVTCHSELDKLAKATRDLDIQDADEQHNSD